MSQQLNLPGLFLPREKLNEHEWHDLMTESTHRNIRSFVLRKGRLTSAQQHALDELWPHYGIEPGETELDFEDHFDNSAEVIVEIGFGNGDSTWQMAEQEPEKNFIDGAGKTPH